MARTILVTGGCRSGKSRYAMELAQTLGERGLYIATAAASDAEMEERISRHRQERERWGWSTLEEPTDLCGALCQTCEAEVLLVDCLTIWISNLMFEASKNDTSLDEVSVSDHCRALIDAARRHCGTVIFVSNEVGMGIAPENATARRFRDLAGRCNQLIAADCDEVTLVASGIPLHLKGKQV